MIKWLFEVLIGWPWCVHKWVVLDRRGLDNTHGSTGQRFYLQCGKCGDVEKRDLI